MLPSGAGTLRDDCEGLPEESLDDARTHSRVLCGLQDTGWVGVSDLSVGVSCHCVSSRLHIVTPPSEDV